MKTIDGNEAAVRVAYKVTETSIIYPITPSSTMGERADVWATKGETNIWGSVPEVVEMQSEAGAAGALHGALQTGALATTYTSSQGLLLMIPNMYKIAGELTSAVIHVASRSLAAQALSIFGDHADVMAARGTGFAMLCSSSVQRAQDMALIAHVSTLEARVPFLHFFDGFRTSHEINKIEMLTDKHIRAMIDEKLVFAHRERALNPENPCVRGTAQNPDVYFQAREAVNPFYAKIPAIVAKNMKKFAELTGRKYNLIDYKGHPQAERVIVIMGSGADTVNRVVEYLRAKGERIGLLRVNLYRPFPAKHFLKVLPKSVKKIAVLDRTKEAGSHGEPLYQDVVTVLSEAKLQKTIIGGRYGLSSKEFTPAMAKGVFDELKKAKPKNHFTIGIVDDVSHTSIAYDPKFALVSEGVVRCLFYGLGADGTVGANKNSIKIIGEGTDYYAQAYFVYDSKKSGSRTVSHLRFGPKPINAPYLIHTADFIGVHQFQFLCRKNILESAAPGATILLNTVRDPDEVWQCLARDVQKTMITKKLKLYVINAYKIARDTGMGRRINTIMQTCFFALAEILPRDLAIRKIKKAIHDTYIIKGEEVVQKNYIAVDQTLAHLYEVKVPAQVSKNALELPPVVSDKAPKFVQEVTAMMMADQGDELPVSALPEDGTYPCGTTRWEKRNISLNVPHWKEEECIQCGRCSAMCPHAVIRVKQYNAKLLAKAPIGFRSAAVKGQPNKRFTLQVYLEDCTGCSLCEKSCPVKGKAIKMTAKLPILTQEKKNIEFFETLPQADCSTIPCNTLQEIQYLEPLFEFSGACAGCGETPYLKLVTQLFGDHMLVANATGCSSIYGGDLPTTPWSCNKNNKGPAWSNSLFEDNAEFGYGFKISVDQLGKQSQELLQQLAPKVGNKLAKDILMHAADNDVAGINKQRERITKLKDKLKAIHSSKAAHLRSLVDFLVRRSVWIIGGDGWAYDIGYGGLDHVLASNRNVNVLVLDTEVYSNTGGQASKATPMAAIAKFAVAGKKTPDKSLGLMAMAYGYVYVAQIAIGADPMQTLKAIKEAEAYDGPSLIIAYCPCIAHGYDLENGLTQQKLAVASGYWPLYRYNPDNINNGENPFILDSKAPSVPLKDYIYNENRFRRLSKFHPEVAKALLDQAQAIVDRRWRHYEILAAEKA